MEGRISRILSAVTARAERHFRVEPDFSVPGFPRTHPPIRGAPWRVQLVLREEQ